MTTLNTKTANDFYSIDAIYQRYVNRFGKPDSSKPVREITKNPILVSDANNLRNSPEMQKSEIKENQKIPLFKTSIEKTPLLKIACKSENYESIFSMTQKEDCGCKYPISGSGIDIKYCSSNKKSGSQFCQEHNDICRVVKKAFAVPSERVLYQGTEAIKNTEDRNNHIAIDVEMRNNNTIVDHYNLYG